MKSLTLSLAGLVLLAAGCQSGPKYGSMFEPTRAVALNNFTTLPSSTSSRSELLQPPTGNYTVGPGDKLQIEILGDQTTRETVLVGPDGKIYYYLLPGIDVWGLTLPQVSQKIQNGLQNYMRGDTQVGVSLIASGSKHVWLLGRFQSPGEYSLDGPTTLLEAIAEAGGPANASSISASAGGALGPSLSGDVADLRRSFVMRDGHVLPVDFYRLLKMGDMSQNIYLEPDDFIYMPSAMAKEVYVLGAVGDPTSVSYNENVTLVGAITAARGTIRNAYLSHVAIVRGTLTNPRIAIVDYKAVLKGDQPNVLLQPGDIVYVPYTPYRMLLAYGDMILRTFVQTVAVNEGARAVSRNAGVVGVAISPGTGSGGGGVVIGGGGGGTGLGGNGNGNGNGGQ
jgi:polysaccharide export outer membrane protein